MTKSSKTTRKSLKDYIPIKAYNAPVVIENIGSTKLLQQMVSSFILGGR